MNIDPSEPCCGAYAACERFCMVRAEHIAYQRCAALLESVGHPILAAVIKELTDTSIDLAMALGSDIDAARAFSKRLQHLTGEHLKLVKKERK